MMKHALAVSTLAWTGFAGASGGAIVDTAFAADAIWRGEAIVWDARGAEDYKKGHIPGAVNIGDAGKVLKNDNTENFIATERIEKIFGGAGIDPGKPVIVYATRGNPYAYFGLYTMQYFGAKNATVYHDGIDGWRKTGQPVSTEDARRAPVQLSLKPNSAVAASTEEALLRGRSCMCMPPKPVKFADSGA